MGSGRARSLLQSARAAATAAAGVAEGAGDPGPRRAARLLREADGGLGLGKDRRADFARSRRTGDEDSIELICNMGRVFNMLKCEIGDDQIDTFIVPPGLGDQSGAIGALELAQRAEAEQR